MEVQVLIQNELKMRMKMEKGRWKNEDVCRVEIPR